LEEEKVNRKLYIFLLLIVLMLPIVFSASPIVVSTISPSPAYYNTTLLGYCNATDDGGAVGYYYKWYKNAVLNSSGSFVDGNTTRGAYSSTSWSMIINRSWVSMTSDGTYLYYLSEKDAVQNSTVYKYYFNGTRYRHNRET